MKSYLNTRQYEILSLLLKEENPRTVEELSNLLHIKARVIQYNLNGIDSWLKVNNTKIIRRSGYGLRIDLSKGQRLELLKQLSGLDNIELILSTQERRRCIKLKMLSDDKPISSSKLGGDFNVSRTTILNDLIEVENSLKHYHLNLVKDPQKGFSLEGHKSVKRFASCELFCEEHFENQIPLANISKIIPSKQPFDTLITEWFDFSDCDFANKFSEKIEHLIKVRYSQATRIGLFYYFLLMLSDIRKQSQITDKVIEETHLFKESAIIPVIEKSIEDHVGAQIHASELQLLILHLHCQSPFYRSEFEFKVNKNDPHANQTIDPSGIGRDLVKEISLFLNPYLQIDLKFTNEIISYINNSMIYRKNGFSFWNPFHKKTHLQFPDTYDTIEKITSNKKYQIENPLTESDISTLTMISINGLERIQKISQKNIRVALISDGNEALISFTKERIISNFPWFKIVGIFRQCDIHRIKAEKVDLILSTIDMDIETIHSTIIIDQFMTNLDIEHIKNWINENAIQKGKGLSSPENVELKDLLAESNIIFIQEVSTWEEAVYAVGKPLIEKGDIKKSYLDAIIQVNKTHGPYSVVSPHIALLHAKSADGVNKLCLGLLILKAGVEFGVPAFDPVNLLFIIGIPDSHTHLHALKELANIIRTRNISEQIEQCKSGEQAIRLIIAHSKK
jgi:mannitol/fructose-specific phosphotransferase system IIA component (Ntr-type)/transcriptional antiterminator